MDRAIARERTALSRLNLSRPIQLALADGLLSHDSDLFDYGCGRGDDLRLLTQSGFACSGWDPGHRPTAPLVSADVVNLGYVVNVIEDPRERANALRRAWSLARRILIVAARSAAELRDVSEGETFGDGVLTRRNTFQKFYEQGELKGWIDATIGYPSVPAAPGVFYVFRESQDRESFLARRFRRRTMAPRPRLSDALFEQHRELLGRLMSFVTERGRLPVADEFEDSGAAEETFGSLPRAFALVRRVTGDEPWVKIREQRREDIRLYLALARFDRRPSFGGLSKELQLDVRALFSTYAKACQAADELLFSVGQPGAVDEACIASPIGKLTPAALYVHRSALELLCPLLRAFEGCARGYLGDIPEANIIKIHRREPKISYLVYPDFERDPHPALHTATTVNLQTFRLKVRRYTQYRNPFILHRKETFLGPTHPLRDKFARLTRLEAERGLLDQTDSIGTRDGWLAVLKRNQLTLRGHRLVRDSTP